MRLHLALLALLLLAGSAQALQLRLPVDNTGGHAIWTLWVIGVDHDPALDNAGRDDCLNYSGVRGFPWCYDQHTGTDFMLQGGFDRMDNGSAVVVAAADGTVVHVEDGHYDRCHAAIGGARDITCDGHEMRANYIRIDHGDGAVTFYYHLMKHSMLVSNGEQVVCGQPLALIGSSGISAGPHLHFQFEIDGEVVDPFAGPESQPESYWVQQEGAFGLPGEYCEGETPPDPDVVEPEPDIVEPLPGPDVVDAGGRPELAAAELLRDEDLFIGPAPELPGEAPDASGQVADESGPFWWNEGGGGFACQAGGSPRPAGLLLLLALPLLLLAWRRRKATRCPSR